MTTNLLLSFDWLSGDYTPSGKKLSWLKPRLITSYQQMCSLQYCNNVHYHTAIPESSKDDSGDCHHITPDWLQFRREESCWLVTMLLATSHLPSTGHYSYLQEMSYHHSVYSYSSQSVHTMWCRYVYNYMACIITSSCVRLQEGLVKFSGKSRTHIRESSSPDLTVS